MKRRKERKKQPTKAQQYLWESIIGLVVIAVMVLAAMQWGIVGRVLYVSAGYVFGDQVSYMLLICGLIAFTYVVQLNKYVVQHRLVIAFILVMLALLLYWAVDFNRDFTPLVMLETFLKATPLILSGQQPFGAGLVGTVLFALCRLLFDVTGTYVVIWLMVGIAVLISFDFKQLRQWLAKSRDFLTYPVNETDESQAKRPTRKLEPITLTEPEEQPRRRIIDLKSETPLVKVENPVMTPVPLKPIGTQAPVIYHLPGMDLLEEPVSTKNAENSIAAKRKGELLVAILQEFGIKVELIDIHIGPSVTKFELRPESGVKVSRISALADDIKMNLAAKDVRIEAPIPGRNAVGVEIPNVKTTPVSIKDVFNQLSAKNARKLTIALGKDLQGQAVFFDLDKMPHLLVAGATGSGKSVCINSIIVSLLLRTTPDEVKLLLIDPKKVEFTQYFELPHLIAPVVTDAQEAAKALKIVVLEMERRYNLFAARGVRNITAYNSANNEQSTEQKPSLPFIVVIIDELADLMMVAGKDVEGSIQRITQLARSAGIHLIVATQRPSTDVITGIIKANIPSRIAFAVSSGIDSRVVLDGVGAERLLGYGDMLYQPIGEANPLRVQGVYVSDVEIDRVTKFVSSQCKPQYNDAFLGISATAGGEDDVSAGFSDPLYEEVKSFVINTRKASTSSIQRRFGLGYNRAARLVDVLEERGIVGPAQGSKPRDVYARKEDDYE